MKFKINSEDFKAALRSVKGGLGVNNLVHHHIKIKAEEDKVNLYTNNVRIGYALSIGSEILEEGTVIVDGETLIRFVDAALSEDILLSTDKNYLVITDGKRKSRILCLEDESFIEPKVEGEVISNINLDILKTLIKVSMNMSAKLGNTELNGICFQESKVMATDRVKGIICTADYEISESIILTKEAAREILKLSYEGDVSLVYNGSFLSIAIDTENESIHLIMQLIGGEYPDLSAVIDRVETSDRVAVSANALYSEINYMALSSSNENQVFKLEIDDKVRLDSVAYMDTVEAHAELDYVDKEFSEDSSIVMNIKVTDILTMLNSMNTFIDSGFFDDDTIQIYIDREHNVLKIELEGVVMLLSAVAG